MPLTGRCELDLGKRLEEVKEFKYLGTVLCKHGEIGGEIRERAVKGRSDTGSPARVMKGRKCIHGGKEKLKE